MIETAVLFPFISVVIRVVDYLHFIFLTHDEIWLDNSLKSLKCWVNKRFPSRTKLVPLHKSYLHSTWAYIGLSWLQWSLLTQGEAVAHAFHHSLFLFFWNAIHFSLIAPNVHPPPFLSLILHHLTPVTHPNTEIKRHSDHKINHVALARFHFDWLCRRWPFLWQHRGHDRVPADPLAEVLLALHHAAHLWSKRRRENGSLSILRWKMNS